MTKEELKNNIAGALGWGTGVSDREVERLTDEIMRHVDRYTQTLLEEVLQV